MQAENAAASLALSVVPMSVLAVRMDSNIVSYERAHRELPSAELSITLPILLAGLRPEHQTRVIDLTTSGFESAQALTKNADNRWRVVNGLAEGLRISEIGPTSPVGRKPIGEVAVEDEE